MKPTLAVARILARLERDGGTAASSLGSGVRNEMAGLFDAGVLRRVRSGRGLRVEVVDHTALLATIRVLFPSGLDHVLAADSHPTTRRQSVAMFRDAKIARRGAGEPVLIRGFGQAVLRRGDDLLALAEWTRSAGVAAVDLDPDEPWGCDGVVAVVENREPFLRVEQAVPDLDVAIYAGGRMSDRLLGWLAGSTMESCRYVHCGDYDPVGIDEYLKLGRACAGRVSLYMPAGLEEVFARFGNRGLLGRSEAVLRRIRDSGDRDAAIVVELMDRFGCGVEQEIVV